MHVDKADHEQVVGRVQREPPGVDCDLIRSLPGLAQLAEYGVICIIGTHWQFTINHNSSQFNTIL